MAVERVVSSSLQASGMISDRSRRLSATARMNLPDPSMTPPTTSDHIFDCTMLGMTKRSPSGAKRLANGQESMVRKRFMAATPRGKPRTRLWAMR